jgi:hypothetical protein
MHVRKGELTAATVINVNRTAWARDAAVDALELDAELCALCSGYLVGVLARLQEKGVR